MSTSYQTIKGNAEPLPDDILVIDMEQGQKITKGGIILADDTSYGMFSDNDAKAAKGIRPRWAKVYKVGENVIDVSPNEYILVEHGRWTYTIDFIDENNQNIKLQKVDPESILIVTTENPMDEIIK